MRNSDAFDAELGPSGQRYFGDGYRAGALELNAIELTSVSDKYARLTAAVHVSAWERSGVERVSHVGTIDAIAIAVTLGTAVLVSAGLAERGTELMLSWIDVQAGQVVQTDAEVIGATAEWDAVDRSSEVQAIRCLIGSLTVRLGLLSPKANTQPLPAGRIAIEDVLSPGWRSSYYAGGYRLATVSATSLQTGASSVSCQYRVDGGPAGLIECLVLTSQMAQVMLYQRAGVSRAETGNLWMRRCSFRATERTGNQRGDASLDLVRYNEIVRPTRHIIAASVEIARFAGFGGSAELAFDIKGA